MKYLIPAIFAFLSLTACTEEPCPEAKTSGELRENTEDTLTGNEAPLAEACPTEEEQQEEEEPEVQEASFYQAGEASYYGPGFHGKLTASGETFNQNAMTAAHKRLPFNTKVRVTNKANNKSVIVRINDRGPYAHGRVIDLSKGAAANLGITNSGKGNVTLEIL